MSQPTDAKCPLRMGDIQDLVLKNEGYDKEWVASPNGEDLSEEELKLVARRPDIIVYGYVNDAEASYSFDDYALISLDGWFYLLHTSGCSCPSPCERWGIAKGPCTLDEIRSHIVDDVDRRGYGVTKRQFQEFLDMIAVAENYVKNNL